MKEHHKGAIVFTGSNTAYRTIPNGIAYNTSKGSINSMSRVRAVDLEQYGIRRNVVLPDTIKTDCRAEVGDKRIVDGTLTSNGMTCQLYPQILNELKKSMR